MSLTVFHAVKVPLIELVDLNMGNYPRLYCVPVAFNET